MNRGRSAEQTGSCLIGTEKASIAPPWHRKLSHRHRESVIGTEAVSRIWGKLHLPRESVNDDEYIRIPYIIGFERTDVVKMLKTCTFLVSSFIAVVCLNVGG
jgi:hypothetical protein